MNWFFNILNCKKEKDILQKEKEEWIYTSSKLSSKMWELEKENKKLKSTAKPILTNQLEEELTGKYPKRNELYSGRYLYGTQNLINIDVRTFLNPNDAMLKWIIDSLKLEGKTDDDKIFECFKWIRKNIRYNTDLVIYGKNEHWDFPFEVLALKQADCEGQALVLANMGLIAGIPYYKLRLSAGWVKDPIGQGEVGHAYLTYYHEDSKTWKLMDTTYYANNLEVKNRKDYKEEEWYKETWFSWDAKYIYAKSIKQMERIKDIGGANNGRK